MSRCDTSTALDGLADADADAAAAAENEVAATAGGWSRDDEAANCEEGAKAGSSGRVLASKPPCAGSSDGIRNGQQFPTHKNEQRGCARFGTYHCLALVFGLLRALALATRPQRKRLLLLLDAPLLLEHKRMLCQRALRDFRR